MTRILSRPISQTKNPVKAFLWIGLIVGTLDIVTALIVYQTSPVRMCQFIASGAVGGEAAFSGGLIMAIVGLLLHYFITLIWAAIFFLFYPKAKIFSKNKYVTGLLYGVAVWFFMNMIVLPLSQISRGPFNFTQALIGMSIIIVMIGLPVAVLTHQYYFSKRVQGR